MKWRTRNPWTIESDGGYRITKAGPEADLTYVCWRGQCRRGKKTPEWEPFLYTRDRDEATRATEQDRREREVSQ